MPALEDLDQHVVVVGSDSTTARLAEELIRAGEDVVVVASGEIDADVLDDLEPRSARFTRGDSERVSCGPATTAAVHSSRQGD